jgi:hypothetical protein
VVEGSLRIRGQHNAVTRLIPTVVVPVFFVSILSPLTLLLTPGFKPLLDAGEKNPVTVHLRYLGLSMWTSSVIQRSTPRTVSAGAPAP